MEKELTEREKEVLSVVVQGFIETGGAVGSRYVAKRSKLNLSPATMRNIMADLTEMGYLKQPHTSAGRLPSDKGIRYYLTYIFEPSPIFEEKQKIKRYFNSTQGYEFSQLLEMTSKFLSNETKLLGIVISPPVSFMKWKHIDFILVRPGLVLAILVFEGGMVHNRLLTVEDKKITSDDLKKFSNYLNERFSGKSLYEVKHIIKTEIDDAKNKFNELYFNALRLAKHTCESDEEREIFVEGAHKFIEEIDLKDIERMKTLLKFIEERADLLKILNKIEQGEGILITFGNELFGDDLDQWTIISSPYGIKDDFKGVIGTIGPLNVDYSKLIPLVDYMAKMLNRILETRL